MDITVHNFKENKLSVFIVSTELFFLHCVSLSLSNYLSGWPKFPYAFIDLSDNPQQLKNHVIPILQCMSQALLPHNE